MASQRTTGNQDRQRAPRAKDERDLNAAQREKQVVELRMQGYDFDSIAEECGYGSRASAYKAWKRALHRMPAPAVEEARKQMALAYDVARKALFNDFATGDHDAIESWLALDERQAKLLGLDYQHKTGGDVAAPKVFIRSYGSADSPVNTDLL